MPESVQPYTPLGALTRHNSVSTGCFPPFYEAPFSHAPPPTPARGAVSTITTAEALVLEKAAADALMHADEAWMLASTALVQIMTPGLAFFCACRAARPRREPPPPRKFNASPAPPPPHQQTLASWARAARCPP